MLRERRTGTAGKSIALAAVLLLAAGCASQKPGSSGGEGAGAGAGGAGAGAGAGAGVGAGADASASAGAGAGAAMPSAPSAGAGAGAAGAGAGTSAGGGSGAGGGSADTGPAQTPDERRAAIDKRFDDTLGTFDSEIRKEQEAVAKERDVRAATAAEAAAGSADTESGEGGEGESGSANGDKPVPGAEGQPQADKRSRAGDLKSDKDRQKDKDKDGGGSNSTGSGASGSAIPDGSDDDIVARRLRKAAEQETDPELKEKLWKEYVEYKKNAGK